MSVRYLFKEDVDLPFPYGDFEFDMTGAFDEMFYHRIRADARMLGEFIEDAFSFTFVNIEKVTGNKTHDLYDSLEDRKIEVRAYTKRVTFMPSSKAVRRRILQEKDSEPIFEKIDAVSDWLFVDVKEFPILKVTHLESHNIATWLYDNENKSHHYTPSILKKINHT